MKPPPRNRTQKNVHRAEPESTAGGKWKKAELRRLLTGLSRLSGARDLDYGAVQRYVPTRSVQQVTSMVDSIRNKVISSISLKLQMSRSRERRSGVPIDQWTYMASAVAGTLEETLTSAFAQVLMVSSTEPCTLRNCYPPPTRASRSRPGDRTRPVPRPLAPGPVLILKTPARTLGPARRLPAPSQVVLLKNVPTGPAPPPAGSGPTPQTTGAGEAPPPCSSSSSAPPRVSRVRCSVNFEKVYNYLSAVQKPKDRPVLTPMESAIVLDLLMSLPEELELLDCRSLRKHLLQVYQSFSAPADSRTHRDRLEEVRRSLTSGGGPHVDEEAEQLGGAPSGRTGSSSQSPPEPCPPFNPFLVPLRLLRRQPT